MCLTSISALRGPAQCYDCQLWLAPAHPYLGWCWLRFISGSPAKFSPPALFARNNVIRWVITPSISCCLEFKEIGKKKIHIDSVFVGFFFCDNCFQGVSQQSQLTGDKLEEQSSTLCLPHCTRAQLQHACLPQQNEKSIHVSHLPRLLQDNWPWHHDLSVWLILFPLGWARGKRHIFQ